MKYTKVAIRTFVVVLSICFLLAITAAWKFKKPAEAKVSRLPENRPPKQATTYIYEPAPFYFGFKTRGASMSMLKPFSQDFVAFGRQNSHGFRTPEYTISHPPNTFRIVILGDLVTWGSGVPVEDTFSYVLAERLNNSCPSRRTEVIALGVNGHKLKENFIKLLAHGASLNPDLVVFQFSQSHLEFYSYFTFFQIHRTQNPVLDYLSKQQEVFKPDSLDWKVMTDSLSEIRQWSKRKSTPVCFLIFRQIDSNRMGNNFHHYDPERMPRNFPLLGTAVKQIRDYGFPTLDLLDTFKQTGDNQYLAVSEIDSSPNALGHSLVANALHSFLLQNHLAGCEGFNLKPTGLNWKSEELLKKEAIARWKDFNVSLQEQASFFERLRQIHPEDPWVLAELAGVNFNLHRYSDSFNLYSSIQEAAPTCGAPWYNMALSNAFRKKRIEFLEKMIQLVPDHAPSMLFLAKLYLDDKRTQEACVLLGQLLEKPSYQEQYDDVMKLYSKSRCSELLKTKPGSQ